MSALFSGEFLKTIHTPMKVRAGARLSRPGLMLSSMRAPLVEKHSLRSPVRSQAGARILSTPDMRAVIQTVNTPVETLYAR